MADAPAIDLSTSRRIHIVGIGGSGMSAIALVLASMGNVVSGTDAVDSAALDRLRDAGVHASVGKGSPLPEGLDALAVSSAVSVDDPEVVAAHAGNIPVLRRAQILSAIAATRRTVAVAGTHGKTTTSTLTALVLESGGMDPSWVIGGEVLGRGAGARWSAGPWLVVEADESDGTFIELGAEAVLITNVERDHLAYYGGFDQLVHAFETFVENASGPKVVCVDDAGAAALAARYPVTTYGCREDAEYRIADVELHRFETAFAVHHGDQVVKVRLTAPGMHNVRNATAALAMGHQVGVPLEVGAAGLAHYGGVGRRFQRRGDRNGVTFVDDYAHLPGEVQAAVAAALDGEWNRVVAVFQPHRYSRTEEVGADFGGSFDGVDLLVLTDVYAAGEEPRPGVSGSIVRKAVEEHPGHPPLIYVRERSVLAGEVVSLLQEGDLCLTLGAGDITKLPDEILALP